MENCDVTEDTLMIVITYALFYEGEITSQLKPDGEVRIT